MKKVCSIVFALAFGFGTWLGTPRPSVPQESHEGWSHEWKSDTATGLTVTTEPELCVAIKDQTCFTGKHAPHGVGLYERLDFPIIREPILDQWGNGSYEVTCKAGCTISVPYSPPMPPCNMRPGEKYDICLVAKGKCSCEASEDRPSYATP